MGRLGRWEVAAIVALLMLMAYATVLAVFQSSGCNPPQHRTRLKLKSVENALRQYSIDNGYPTQIEGLAVLNNPPGGEKPYLKEPPRDGWNRPVVYLSGPVLKRWRWWLLPRPGEAFRVASAGEDGVFGTTDDIYLRRPSKKRRF